MRNLKKILALVLALVMSMSLVTVASAEYADEDQIDARYAEAVEVLSDMGIFQGYNGGESFGPKQSITREEVATMMYRVISADVKGKAGLYVEACNFADVNNGRWSEGYIGYCFNGNYVKGYEDGTFRPTADVTGYEVLAMILRAVGYDANNEFSGSEWKKNIATRAQQLGILDNLAPSVVLSKPATREVVAELIFQTIANVWQVEYTNAFNYQPIVSNIAKAPTTIGMDNFGLVKGERTEIDKWGRPGYYWYYNTGSTCIEEAYVTRYTNAVSECQLYYDLNGTYTGDQTVKYFVNGMYKSYTYKLESTDYVQTLGGQGTQLELYKDRIVMIETWLAEVVNVTPVVKDAAGHVVTKATMTLAVYDQGYNVAPSTHTMDNYVNYNWEIGDYLLINCNSTTNHVDTTTNEVVHDSVYRYNIKIVGEAPARVGAQTYIWRTADKHTIEGVDYNDAAWFCLDKAGESPAKFNWLFDQFNNVIGVVELPAAAPVFGILLDLQWINPQGASGYAQGTIMYTDGTTELKTIYAIDQDMDGALTDTYDVLTEQEADLAGDPTYGTVSDNYAKNANYLAKDLYRVKLDAKGRAILTHVNNSNNYGYTTGTALTKNELAAADVKNGNYAMGNQYVNGDTIFMVYKNRAWTLVTGYDKIGNYTNAKVDWLNTDSDPYVEFAFVIGSADDENGLALWFKTTESYRHDVVNGKCEVTGLLDGTATTVSEYYCLHDTNIYDLYALQYTNGVVTGKTALTNGSTYGNYKIAVIPAGAAAATTYNGVVLNDLDGLKFNVVGLATTFGTWEANLGDHEIWVVYYTRTSDGANIATQVYIVPSAGLSGDGNASSGTVSYNTSISVDSFTYVNNAFVMNISTTAAISGEYDITVRDAAGAIVAYTNNVAMANGTNWVVSQAATVVSGATYTVTVEYDLDNGKTAADTVRTITVH